MPRKPQNSRPQPDLGGRTRQRLTTLLVASLSLAAMCVVGFWLFIVGMGVIDFVEGIVPLPLLMLGVLISIAFMLIVSLLRLGDG